MADSALQRCCVPSTRQAQQAAGTRASRRAHLLGLRRLDQGHKRGAQLECVALQQPLLGAQAPAVVPDQQPQRPGRQVLHRLAACAGGEAGRQGRGKGACACGIPARPSGSAEAATRVSIWVRGAQQQCLVLYSYKNTSTPCSSCCATLATAPPWRSCSAASGRFSQSVASRARAAGAAAPPRARSSASSAGCRRSSWRPASSLPQCMPARGRAAGEAGRGAGSRQLAAPGRVAACQPAALLCGVRLNGHAPLPSMRASSRLKICAACSRCASSAWTSASSCACLPSWQ